MDIQFVLLVVFHSTLTGEELNPKLQYLNFYTPPTPLKRNGVWGVELIIITYYKVS